jgi:hypothetical protein
MSAQPSAVDRIVGQELSPALSAVLPPFARLSRRPRNRLAA